MKAVYNISLVGFILAAALTPVWSVTQYITNDGPVHIGMAVHARSLLEGGGISSDFFTLSSPLVPNVLTQFLTMGLLGFLDPLLAEKVLQSLCISLPILGAAYAVGANTLRGVLAAAVVAVFAHNEMFRLGTYSFIFGLGIWLILASYLVRSQWRVSPGATAILFVGFAALYFIHGFVAAIGIAVLVVARWTEIVARNAGGTDRFADFVRQSLRDAAMPALAAVLPTALILAFVTGFIAPTPEYPPTPAPVASSIAPQAAAAQSASAALEERPPLIAWLSHTVHTALYRLSVLPRARVLVDNQTGLVRFLVPSIVWALALAALLTRIQILRRQFRDTGRPQVDASDPFLAMALLMLLVYVTIPDGLGGGWTHVRRATLMFMSILAVWAVAVLPKRFVAASTVVAVPLALWLSAIVLADNIKTSAQVDEIRKVIGDIETPATLLPVVYSIKGVDQSGDSLRLLTAPLYQAYNIAEYDGDVVALTNFLARLRPYLVWFKGHANPYQNLFTDWIKSPFSRITYEILNVENYEQSTRRCVDYLGVFGRPETTNPTLLAETRRLTATKFLPVTCSEGGLACLYRRVRKTDVAAPGREPCLW